MGLVCPAHAGRGNIVQIPSTKKFQLVRSKIRGFSAMAPVLWNILLRWDLLPSSWCFKRASRLGTAIWLGDPIGEFHTASGWLVKFKCNSPLHMSLPSCLLDFICFISFAILSPWFYMLMFLYVIVFIMYDFNVFQSFFMLQATQSHWIWDG